MGNMKRAVKDEGWGSGVSMVGTLQRLMSKVRREPGTNEVDLSRVLGWSRSRFAGHDKVIGNEGPIRRRGWARIIRERTQWREQMSKYH